MKRIEIKNDTFEFISFVFWDCKLSEAAAWCHKHLKGFPDGLREKLLEDSKMEEKDQPQGITYSNSGNFVIWVEAHPDTIRGKILIAHEATHAAIKVLKHWSMDPLDRSGDELMAILVGNILGKVMTAIYKKKSTKPSVKKRTRARVKSK